MKKVLNKIYIVISILALPFLMTGCVSGMVSTDDYCDLINGVNAYYSENDSVYFDMRTLIDVTEFNESIQSKSYCKLEIDFKKSCQIKGIVFNVRSSKDCVLKFTTLIDDEEITFTNENLLADKVVNIAMFFDSTFIMDSTRFLSVKIDEEMQDGNSEKSTFQFDDLIIFLGE